MPRERPRWLARWAEAHARAFFFALGKLGRQPLGSLITAAVIGITLALPAGLEVLVRNVSTVGTAWQGTVQATLYLQPGTETDAGEALATQLTAWPEVARADYRSPEANLAEFRSQSGFAEALELLDDNPLPGVILLQPAVGLDEAAVVALMARLDALPAVEAAKLDQQWLSRLNALLRLVTRAVWIVAFGLGLAVMLTVGNTLRLEIEHRREEILVMKLIGAPDAFIRRPFLYSGVAYGLAGSLLAFLLVEGTVLALTGPAALLSALYDSGYAVRGLTLDGALALVLAGPTLGWLGAFWTVHRHLDAIEPGT